MTFLVTGGTRFIGANFVLDWLAVQVETSVNLDKLTYEGNLETLASPQSYARHVFVHGDIDDVALVTRLLDAYQPWAVVNFVYESHVGRCIPRPGDFIETNIAGTFRLLQLVRGYWSALPDREKLVFRFLHVSTDKEYGSLAKDDSVFFETHSYEPNSPFNTSKCANYHLVRVWQHSYGLPELTTNCSNNIGPYYFHKKLIPIIIVNALAGKSLPCKVTTYRSVTGSMSRTTAARSVACSKPDAWAKPTTWVAGTRSQTSRSSNRLQVARQTAPHAGWQKLRHVYHLHDRPHGERQPLRDR